MSGLVILKYFCPILDKKDPPEDMELYSIRLGHYQRLYHSIRQSFARQTFEILGSSNFIRFFTVKVLHCMVLMSKSCYDLYNPHQTIPKSGNAKGNV